MSKFNNTYNRLKDKFELGLNEKLNLFFTNTNTPVLIDVEAKVDSGNDGYMVLHGKVLEQTDDFVRFQTIKNKILRMKKIEDVIIHIGSGVKETRPVVAFDVEIEGKRYKNILFSIADRSDNEQPILISKDFISLINGVINVNKNDE